MAAIISLNIDRRVTNLMQAAKMAHKRNIDIINIQDTPIKLSNKPLLEINTLFKDYELIEHEHNTKLWTLRNKLSTSIWKHPVTHTLDDSVHITLIGTLIESQNNTTIKAILANIYIRPRASPNSLNKALQTINEYTMGENSRLIITGDCNAQSIMWQESKTQLEDNSYTNYNNIKANRGRQLVRFMSKNKLWCANTELPKQHTFIGIDGQTTIDLVLLGSRMSRHFATISYHEIQKLGHKIVMLTLNKGEQGTQPATTVTYRHNINKIVPQMFESFNIEADRLVNNWHQLDRSTIEKRMNTLCNKLYATLLDTQNKIKSRNRRRTGNQSIDKGSWLRKLIRKLRKAETKTQLQSKNQNKHTDPCTHKRNKARQNHIRRQLIRNIVGKELETEDSLWTRVRKLEPTDTTTNQLVQLDKETLEQLMETKFPATIRDSVRLLEKEIKPTELSLNEINAAIMDIRDKKFTGPEGLKFQVFNKAMEFVGKYIIQICRMSFKIAKIPLICHKTQGTLIPKAKQGEFRIVHVGTPLSSLLETIALHKLEHQLEANQLVSRRQYGFTANRGRHDLIARVLERVLKHHQTKPSEATTTLVSLDIEGAFDNVNQDTIINNIHNNLEHPIRHWLIEFILNRSISIRNGSITSSTRQICKGVPQGSPLGPVLWNLTINKLAETSTTNLTETLMYADDLLIVHNSNQLEPLQTHLDSITHQLKAIKLNVKAEKCAYMMVRAAPRTNERVEALRKGCALTINDQQISRATSLKVLGITITDSLRLDRLAPSTIGKLEGITKKLHRLRLYNVVHSAQEWRTLIDSLLISTLVNNNLPVLAVDKPSREWIDKLIATSCRRIFDWSSNISTKLIKLILDIHSTDVMVESQLCKRTATEHHESYAHLLEHLRNHSRPTPTRTNQPKPATPHISPLKPSTARRYHNPQLLLTSTPSSTQTLTHDKAVWMIKEIGNTKATAVLVLNGALMLEVRTTCNQSFTNGYCNTMSMIHLLVTDRTIRNRSMLLIQGSSASSAILNRASHDYRVISIRESLSRQGWTLCTTTNEQFTTILDNTLTYSASLDLSRALDETDKHHARPTQTTSNQNPPDQTNSNQLDFSDYKARYLECRRVAQRKHHERNLHQTSTTLAIAPHAATWTKLNPAHIDNLTMMMLTGLVQDLDGSLTMSKTTSTGSYKGCNWPCGRNRAMLTSAVLNQVPRELTNTDNSLIHRLFECSRHGEAQQAMLTLYNRANHLDSSNRTITIKGLDTINQSTLTFKAWLRVLTSAAFPNTP